LRQIFSFRSLECDKTEILTKNKHPRLNYHARVKNEQAAIV